MLLNLVGNAIKFTQQGEVFLEVSLREESGTHSLIHFTVRDTGIGVSPEAKARLFQPFVQAESSTARRFGGTGLGLAICRRLVEMMEGSIGVDSEQRVGSTFWFTLRLGHPESAANLPDSRLRPGTSLEGVRTLICDDNATNRKILDYQVAGWRMSKVGSVSNGFDALDALEAALARQEPVKVAILDFQMPGMDGLGLARRIQSRAELRGTRLIILTSMCERIQPEELRAAGVDAWLVKPVKPSHLYDAIANALAKEELIRGSRKDRNEHAPAPPSNNGQFAKDYPGKLLVVEDSTINQKLAVKLLEKLGYVPDLASDGLQAIEALRRTDYDLIFMDCQMPEMDGYEATRRIRMQSERTRQPRIVAMTANAMKGDKELCLAAGMDDYVSKPISTEEVKRALREGLANPASQVSAAL